MQRDMPDTEDRRDPITQKLLRLLYNSRKAKGWTVRDLAGHAGISPSYVSLIENGHKIPDAATIERLGRALELNEKLLSAWVTVRGRSDDTRKTIDAAYELMELLGGEETMVVREARSEYLARERSSNTLRGMQASDAGAESDRFVVGIPMLDEGTLPRGAYPLGSRSAKWHDNDEATRTQRKFWLDRRTLPDRGTLANAWAWRLTMKGAVRFGRGIYRGGTTVVMSAQHWSRDSVDVSMVFAVRTDAGAVLSRLSLTKEQVVLLPTAESEAVVIPAGGDEGLRRIVVGRVIVAVERYW